MKPRNVSAAEQQDRYAAYWSSLLEHGTIMDTNEHLPQLHQAAACGILKPKKNVESTSIEK